MAVLESNLVEDILESEAPFSKGGLLAEGAWIYRDILCYVTPPSNNELGQVKILEPAAHGFNHLMRFWFQGNEHSPLIEIPRGGFTKAIDLFHPHSAEALLYAYRDAQAAIKQNKQPEHLTPALQVMLQNMELSAIFTYNELDQLTDLQHEANKPLFLAKDGFEILSRLNISHDQSVIEGEILVKGEVMGAPIASLAKIFNGFAYEMATCVMDFSMGQQKNGTYLLGSHHYMGVSQVFETKEESSAFLGAFHDARKLLRHEQIADLLSPVYQIKNGFTAMPQWPTYKRGFSL
ncbi:MAG: hypothetical protein ACOYK8_00875 [Alphaproteobacteria bacterium]